MATRKSHLGRAVQLMVRTRPFLKARLAVYGVFFFATIGYTTTFLLLLRANNDSAVAQLLILASAGTIYWLGRRYLGRFLTYAGHAPHVLCMVEAIRGEKLPKGNAQLEWANRRLDEHFPDGIRMLQLEGLVMRTLRETRDLLIKPGDVKPFPGFDKLGKLGALIARASLRTVRDAIFGYAIWTGESNVWSASRKGVVLYAERAADIITSAMRVYFTGVLVGLLILSLSLAPSWTRTLISWGADLGIIMLISVWIGLVKAAWVIKTAVYDPIALAWMLSVFVRQAEDAPVVDEVWAERLADSSKRFRELTLKARGAPVVKTAAGRPSKAAPKAPREADADDTTPPTKKGKPPTAPDAPEPDAGAESG